MAAGKTINSGVIFLFFITRPVKSKGIRTQKFSEPRLLFFQLALHSSYAVFQFFGGQVLPHAINFYRKTKRG